MNKYRTLCCIFLKTALQNINAKSIFDIDYSLLPARRHFSIGRPESVSLPGNWQLAIEYSILVIKRSRKKRKRPGLLNSKSGGAS